MLLFLDYELVPEEEVFDRLSLEMLLAEVFARTRSRVVAPSAQIVNLVDG